MTYDPVMRRSMYERAAQEVRHLLSIPELHELTTLIKLYSRGDWDALILLNNPEEDFYTVLHTLDNLISLYSHLPWLRCCRAFLLCGMEYYAAAREDIEAALYDDPHHLAAKQILAEIYYHSHHYEESFAAISDVIKQEPLCTRAYMDRVILCKVLAYRTKSTEEKKTFYEMALADLQKLMNLLPSPEIESHIKGVRSRLEKLA